MTTHGNGITGRKRTPRRERATRRGFALVLALSLMAFMVLLLTSLVTISEVESQAAASTTAEAQARQNALLALRLAMGRLQSAAGPDQRVTARAELLDSDPATETIEGIEHPFWTGVWDTRADGDPVWLVSGRRGETYPTPDKVLEVPAVTLVGEHSAGMDETRHVAVGLEPVRSRMQSGSSDPLASVATGNFAYWVGDEGVKTSLALTDSVLTDDTLTIGQLDRTEAERLRQITPVRMGAEYLFSEDGEEPPFDPDSEEDDIRENLRRVLTREQFAGASGLPLPEEGSEEPTPEQATFHESTPIAYGVLADTSRETGGGLKTDLSVAPELLGTGFADWADFSEYMEPAGTGPIVESGADFRRRHRMRAPPVNASEGELIHSVAPVLTDLGIQFVVKPKTSSNPAIVVGMQAVVEMWNPYTTALVPEELRVDVEGLPEVIVHFMERDPDTNAWTENGNSTLDLHALFGDPVKMRLNFEPNRVTNAQNKPILGGYDQVSWGPGRIMWWTGPGNVTRTETGEERANFYEKISNVTRWEETSLALFPTTPDLGDQGMRYETLEDVALTITVRLERTGEVLYRLEEFLFDAMDTGVKDNLSSSWSQHFFGFQVRLKERGHTFAGDRSLWLKENDPRWLYPTFGPAASDAYFPHLQNQFKPDAYFNYLQITQDNMFYTERKFSTSQYGAGTVKDFPLFELPRQPLLSLGQLQHMQVGGRPPFSIGNSWGGELNDVFDQHFLSGMDADLAAPDLENGSLLPHPRLALFREGETPVTSEELLAAGAASGQHFLVKGAFNFNSTSVKAWEAFLTSNINKKWPAIKTDNNRHDAVNPAASETEELDLPPVFFRFPQSMQELHDLSAREFNDPELFAPSQFFRMGLTVMSPRIGIRDRSSDWDASDTEMVRDLAEEIVERIKQRERPFPSFEEFLAPGESSVSLLEAAMAEVPAIHTGYYRSGRNAAPIPIEERTPAYLSQADILQGLGPAMSPRSDTFLIRSYGEVTSPIDGTRLARAYCEAVVQRVPTPADPKDAATEETVIRPEGKFGRKFRLVSFRWLDSSDI